MTNSPDQVELVPTVVTVVALRSSDRPHRGPEARGLVFRLLAIAGSLMALERLDADEV